MQTVSIVYTIFLVCMVFFSYFFVDSNFPIPQDSFVHQLTNLDPAIKTIMYVGGIVTTFSIYLFCLLRINQRKLSSHRAWILLFINAILLLSYPAYSFDIFNYIATARVAFQYGENPYIVMPIELSYEPMLAFMHAANKTALYGPVWILLTALPFFGGGGNLFLSIVTFKIFNFLFYIGTCYILYVLSRRNLFKLALFALNPLVIIETLVSGHNDIVMVFFALLSFYFLSKKIFILSIVAIIFSVFIKYATIVLIPVYLYIFFQQIYNKQINWQTVWLYCFASLLVVFALSPLREEMYSWYFIWPFAFLVLTDGLVLIKAIAVAMTFGLLMRFAPFIYFRSWEGITPLVKIIVTIIPVSLSILFYPLYRKRLR